MGLHIELFYAVMIDIEPLKCCGKTNLVEPKFHKEAANVPFKSFLG